MLSYNDLINNLKNKIITIGEYKIRSLDTSDSKSNFFNLFEVFDPDVSKNAKNAENAENAENFFNFYENYTQNISKIIYVMEKITSVPGTETETDTDTTTIKNLLGTISLIIEQKPFRNLQYIIHIEDVIINKNEKSGGLGKMMLQKIINMINSFNQPNTVFYKIILDCSKSNEGFYLKNGFENKGVYMGLYFINKL